MWTGISHRGLVRDENQDAWLVRECGSRGLLAVVADGMGGHNGGRLAAEAAVQAFVDAYLEVPGVSPGEWLDRALAWANQAVEDRSLADAGLAGMGSTLTALVCWQDMVWLASVGDSRAYRVRDGECTQLSIDDTVAARLLRQGAISADEFIVHPQRHVLTRAIGAGKFQSVRCAQRGAAAPGDRYLLATDGLYGYFLPDELGDRLAQGTVGQSLDELMALSLARGGEDNLTGICISLPGGPTADTQGIPRTVPISD